MSNLVFVISPLAGAAIGWIANKILLGIIAKKITSRRGQLAQTLGDQAASLIDLPAIMNKIKDPANLAHVKPIIATHVDTFLQVKLKEKMPAIAMFVSGSTLDKLRDGLLEEIDILLPDVIAGYADNIGSNNNLQKAIRDKIAALPADKTAKLFTQTFHRELLFIQLYGALAGFITGLLTAIISSW